jgi:3-methyladenine DNA glycosylase/8-oxoguanine DNA glycosylase
VSSPFPDLDLEDALRALRASDPKLDLLISAVGPCGLKSRGARSPFAALAESIAYQQLTGKAAATIFSRVVALYRPRRFPSPEDILATPDGALRGAGLSRSKVASIKDLSAKTLDGTVPTLARLHALTDEEIVERLTLVRGIGRWTVEMLLMFHLGRPDVLPASDYGVRKGFKRAIGTRGLPTPAQVLRRGERWRPYRSVASWYLWRAAETPGGRA